MAYEDEQPRGIRYAQGPNPMRYSRSPAPGAVPPTVETRLPRTPVQPAQQTQTPLANDIPGQSYTAPPVGGIRTAAAPAAAVAAPAGPSLTDSAFAPTSGFMPGTRAVMRGAGEDISRAVSKGDYAGAVGSTIRGAMAMPFGIIEDTIEPVARMGFGDDPVVGNATARLAAGVLGREAPAPGQPKALVAGATATPALPQTQTDVQRQGGNVPALVPAARQNSFGNVTGDTAFENRGQVTEKNLALADRLVTPRTAFAPTENSLPAGYGVTVGTDSGAGELAARNAGVRSAFADSGLSARQRANIEVQREQTAATRDAASMRDATERRGQDITDSGFQRKDKVTMRGQDLEYGSKQLQTAASMQKAQQDQRNTDRNYELEKAKFGVDVAEKNRAARSASSEAFRKDMETRFVGADGKPDTAKVAAFSTALTSTIPRMIEQLEATGKPEAVAKAKAIRERGTAALEPGDIDGMQRLFDTRERMRQAKGIGPNSATFQDSDNLMDYRQTGVEKTVIGGNRVVTPAGSVSIKDLQYADGPANAILPDWFKTDSRNLTRGLRTE